MYKCVFADNQLDRPADNQPSCKIWQILKYSRFFRYRYIDSLTNVTSDFQFNANCLIYGTLYLLRVHKHYLNQLKIDFYQLHT